MRIRRTLASLAVVTLASTTLAACGGGDEATSGTGGSSSASAKADAGESASSGAADTAEASGDLKELDRDGLVRAVTENTLKAGSGHMTMSMGGAQGIDAEGDVDYTGGTPSMTMTMTGDSMGDGAMELRFVDSIMYLSIPGMTPAGKFIKIDPKDKSNPMARSMGDLDKQMDPLSSVKAMQAGVKTVKLVGPEDVDGTATNHYEVTVDTKKTLASIGGDQSAAGMLPDTLTYDMWLDSDDLLRKMVFDLANAKTTMTMSDWGKKVDITAPPAGKIVRAPGQQ